MADMVHMFYTYTFAPVIFDVVYLRDPIYMYLCV